MKQHIFASLMLGILACAAHAQPANPAAAPSTNAPPKTDFSNIFKSDKDKFSYAIGMYWCSGVKSRLQGQELEYDPQVMAKAFTDALTGAPTLITEAQEREILNDLNTQLSAKRDEKRKQQAEELRVKGEKNLVDGPAFLAKNKTEPGVITLPSGLQYKVLTDGTGPKPMVNDEITVTYRGSLTDGTEFDSSFKRNRPYTIKLQAGPGGVIKGWVEALQLMSTGSKWKIFVPADLAYGANPYGQQIPANSVLVFEIELLGTKSAAAAGLANPVPVAPNAAVHQVPSAPLTSDIIKVPSAEEMKKGAKIETIKPEDLEKEKAKANP